MKNDKLNNRVRKKLGMSKIKTEKTPRVKAVKIKVQTPIRKGCCGKKSG